MASIYIHYRVGSFSAMDGQIMAERYNYERKPDHRMLSNSMAKTIVALAIGKALEEGRIRSVEGLVMTNLCHPSIPRFSRHCLTNA